MAFSEYTGKETESRTALFKLPTHYLRTSAQSFRLFVFLFTLFLFPVAALSQSVSDITWQSSIRISGDSIPSTTPQVIAQGDTVHVVWFGIDDFAVTESDGIQYSRSIDGGISFSTPKSLFSYDFAPSTSGKFSGWGPYLYIVSTGVVDTFFGMFLLRSSDAGATWDPPQPLHPSVFPLIITASDSAAFIQYQSSPVSFGMLRSTDFGTTWGITSPVMPKLDGMVVSRGYIHGVGPAASRIDQEIGYYYSPNQGVTWIEGDILSGEDVTRSINAKIAANERGNLFVVWSDTGTVVTRSSRNNGGSWTPQITISPEIGAVITSVSASKEFVAVAWDKDVGGFGGIGLRSSNDYAQTYFPFTTPTNNTNAREPHVFFNGNRLHVAWQEEINGDVEIFYRQGSVQDNPDLITRPPRTFLLRQNFPNPFNGTTRIEYHLPVEADGSVASLEVTLDLFNILGEKVRTVFRETQSSGRYVYYFEAVDLPSGMYLYRLSSSRFAETKKLIIVR